MSFHDLGRTYGNQVDLDGHLPHSLPNSRAVCLYLFFSPRTRAAILHRAHLVRVYRTQEVYLIHHAFHFPIVLHHTTTDCRFRNLLRAHIHAEHHF